MKVLYLHQHFQTNSGGTRSYEFSKFLVECGHDVTMITGKNIEDSTINGISVKSTNTRYSNNYSFIKRILSFIHFMIKSTIIGLREKNPDIIFATSTPLTIGVPALIISKLKRKTLVFEVRDVWPDVPIEMGFIKSSLMIKTLHYFEKIIYKHSSHIIVLSEGMKENLLKKGVPTDKISIITNLSMNYYFDKVESSKRQQSKNKFVCIHAGTMGIVNGLDFILDIAEEFPNDEIVYLLIGEGNQKEKLVNRVKKNKIKNVIIKDAMPKNKIIKEIKNSDVGIMTVANFPILKDNSANKFFDYLAAGLPILINYDGWQKKVLENNKAGKSFNYHNKRGFYNFLVKLKNDKNLLKEYSQNAKRLAVEEYDSRLLAQKFEEILFDFSKKNSEQVK